MMKVLEMPFLSWEELSERASAYGQAWFFRGEPDADRPLNPKAGRWGGERGSPRKYPYSKEHEIRVFDLFKKGVSRYSQNLSRTPQHDIEWLALAQHYGLPTRLLDWSNSINVATFFAFEQAGTVGIPVIYAVKDVEPFHVEINPFELEEVKLYRPPNIIPRISTQGSVFTVHPNPTQPFVYRTLERWTFRGNKAQAFGMKKKLAELAVNYDYIFQDLDGLCKSAAWLYKWAFFEREDN